MKYLRLFTNHGEKIIFLILLLALIILNVNLILKIHNEVNQSENRFRIKFAGNKDKIKEMSFSNTAFKKLEETLVHPKSFIELQKRNIFNKKIEKQIISDQKEVKKAISIVKDSDQDGMPDAWEKKYGLDPKNPFDAKKDKDQDGFINLDEYIGGTDPTDPESFPGMMNFKVTDIYRKRVKIKFQGYTLEPDGDYRIQINWANRTYFLPVGKYIRGYEIVDFTKQFTTKYNPVLGADENIEISYIRIRKKDEKPIKLIIKKSSFEHELFAKIIDDTGKKYKVHNGSKIKSYEVLDITFSTVIIERNEKSYTLIFERRG